jgi:hypothetical protein
LSRLFFSDWSWLLIHNDLIFLALANWALPKAWWLFLVRGLFDLKKINSLHALHLCGKIIFNMMPANNLQIPLDPPLSKGDLACLDLDVAAVISLAWSNLYRQPSVPVCSRFFPPFEKGGPGGIFIMHLMDTPFHMLREPGQKSHEEEADIDIADETEKSPSGPEKYILCRQCTQVITSSDERISVEGSHFHTFANPHGVVFDIACFRSVIGCGYAGPPSDEFTWFKGFSWRIAVCGMCLTHLGWLFISGGDDNFHGLIRNRIAETYT